MIDENEYMKSGGSHCPYCKSTSLEGQGSPQIDGAEVTQEIECLNCHKSWHDLYSLTGIFSAKETDC